MMRHFSDSNVSVTKYLNPCDSCKLEMICSKLLIFVITIILDVVTTKYFDLDLPEEHLKYYFNSFPEENDKCEKNDECPYKKHLNKKVCWGYENECFEKNTFPRSKCPGDHKGWVSSKKAQLETFYAQGDFGYVKDQRNEMKVICDPLFIDDSSLECTDHLKFCRGRNIMLNFKNLTKRKDKLRYNMDVLAEGEIGGYCILNEKRLQDNADHISALQSWGPEIRHFRKTKNKPIINGDCDVVIEKPT